MPIPFLPRLAGLAALSLIAGCTSQTSRYDAEMAKAANASIIVCHGFDCRRKTRLTLSDENSDRLAAIMATGSGSAAAEREAIRRATAYYEQLSTAVIGVADLPKSDITQSGVIGQMDCIDESTNTRALLLHLAGRGLLHHHSVEMNRSRGLFVDGRHPHSTAVVRDKSGKRWAIDSWYEPAGGLPDVMPLDQWVSRGVLGQR